MSRNPRSLKPRSTVSLPDFAARAAARLGIDLEGLRGWALRPDGSVVLLAANGMKFVVAPNS